MKKLIFTLSLLSIFTVFAFDGNHESEPMTLEIIGIRYMRTAEPTTERLILSLCIKNCSNKIYFIPESGFWINFYLQNDKAENLTNFEYKHSLHNKNIQGLAIPPLGASPLLVNCMNLKLPIENGIIRISFKVCEDTDLSNANADRTFYMNEIKSQFYEFAISKTNSSKPNFISEKNFQLKPISLKN